MPKAMNTLLPCGSANKPAYRWTRLDGRQTTWTPRLVARLAALWAAGFHHEAIAEALDVGPRAASSNGREVTGRYCALSGMWFYGLKGAHTSPEAKLTLRYQEGA